MTITRIFKHLSIVTALMMLLGTAAAQQADSDEVKQFIAEQSAVVKDTANFDWIRLLSGEWLKGELKSVYSEEVEFESDILDTLFIDVEDVSAILSGREYSVRFDDGTVLSGSLNIAGGRVIVGDSPAFYSIEQLVSIAPTLGSGWKNWSINIGAGINWSKGNTDQTEGSLTADIKWRTATYRYLTDILATRTEIDDEVTKSSVRANGTFDWFYTNRLYIRPVIFEYFRDPFQNIASRYSLGAGAGYYIIDDSRTEWDITAGPLYQKTKFDTVGEGEDDSVSSTSFFVGTTYEYELTSDIDLSLDYRYIFASDEIGGDSQYAQAGLEVELTNTIDLDLAFVWDHQDSPVADSDGVRPKKDDYKTIVSLSVDF
ncbi:DUF481 domain-containing protein [Alteromonas aestuariivivens]|uniref:DUF481 domain-containing protein n=1 Tax=Alteromonas aestuariivivens TaxID=1938339 RepID=A0A3D8MCG6_9ALTE|nr:DUF481 domain-containing protein [Alteromonas aestuariivivens]RDV28196.1 DUF481 domain-containing protein [Alteromonas aestuariivivens]